MVPNSWDKPARLPRPALTVAIATLGFAVTYWVWALLAPFGPELTHWFGLGPVEQGLLVGLALTVGALGRFPVGVLTDRYGARVMLPVVSAAAAIPLVAVAFVASVPALVAVACAFGVAGTMFAVGAAAVARAHRPGRRGRALGVFGAGLVGAAIAGVTSSHVFHRGEQRAVLLLAAAALIVFAVAAAVIVRDGPNLAVDPSALRAAAAALRIPAVPPLAVLSALALGTLTATAMYLPAYLRTEYALSWAHAVLLTTLFVTVSAVLRPVGGDLADRHPPIRVLAGCFALAGAGALLQAFTPPLLPAAIITLAAVAVGLGAASGALLALIGIVAPPDRVGAVAGAVGAAGALSAVVPPLLMAGVYMVDGSFGIGMTILSALLLTAAAYLRTRPRWLDTLLPAPADDRTTGRGGATVVAVSWADLRRDAASIAAAVADLAGREEVLIVQGDACTPAHRQPAHRLVAALRERLPAHRIAAALVDTSAAAGRWDTELVEELLNDGAVTIAVAPTTDPRWAATILAERIGADRVLQLTTRSGTIDLTPLGTTTGTRW